LKPGWWKVSRASDHQKLLCFDEIGETIGTTKIIRAPANGVQATILMETVTVGTGEVDN
jgi:hypothetical protein